VISRAAAREITRTTEETEAIVYRLAVLLGLSVTLIPIAPVLGVYLPLRLRRRSYVAGLRRQVRSGQGGPALDAFLAHQAVSTMSFGELRSVTADPVGDLLAGRHRELADEHLRRLGITRRATGAWRASP